MEEQLNKMRLNYTVEGNSHKVTVSLEVSFGDCSESFKISGEGESKAEAVQNTFKAIKTLEDYLKDTKQLLKQF